MSRKHFPRMDPPDGASLGHAPYGTYIQSRHPIFKMHPNIGQAKAALTTGCWDGYDDEAFANGFLYEFQQGFGWVLVASVFPGQRKSIHPLWNQYIIPEYEEPVDWQAKIKTKTRTKKKTV